MFLFSTLFLSPYPFEWIQLTYAQTFVQFFSLSRHGKRSHGMFFLHFTRIQFFFVFFKQKPHENKNQNQRHKKPNGNGFTIYLLIFYPCIVFLLRILLYLHFLLQNDWGGFSISKRTQYLYLYPFLLFATKSNTYNCVLKNHVFEGRKKEWSTTNVDGKKSNSCTIWCIRCELRP